MDKAAVGDTARVTVCDEDTEDSGVSEAAELFEVEPLEVLVGGEYGFSEV